MNEEKDAENNHNESAPPIQRLSERSKAANTPATGAPTKTKTPPTCKFYLTKRGCAYGAECKFSHKVQSEPTRNDPVKNRSGRGSRLPVCRHFTSSSSSGCKYGDKCRYRHPTQQRGVREDDKLSDSVQNVDLRSDENEEEQMSVSNEKTVLLDLTSFPGLTSNSHTSKTSQQHTSTMTHPPSNKPHPPKKHAPTELSLGSFMTTPTTGGTRPHPPVNRPHRANRKTTMELRQAELEQLETRFQGNHRLIEKGRERTVYRLTFAPSDPDWNFSFKTFDLDVIFPSDYPSQPLLVTLPDDQGLHPTYITHGNLAISRYLATAKGGSEELMFRPFLHWLDRTITNVFKEAAKELVGAELFAGSNYETTPPEDHTHYSTDDDDSGSSDDETDQSDDESDEQLPLLLETEKRGTEMRLNGVVMSDGVGVGRCDTVRVTLQCTRCRCQQDQTVKGGSPTSQLCSQCQHCFSFSYRPAVFHPTSPALGFLDLQGCVPVDLILMQCETTLTCLECGRDNTTLGMNYGEHRDLWCKRCHMKLALYVEQCRFIQHRAGTTVLPTTLQSSGKKRSKKAKEAVIQVGKPLPEFGTCTHYKKSNRWLRFPCCGKPFPCDVCHDEAEDHVMERANRMICGFCCREQTYSSTRPCVGCGFELVGGRVGTFWEGGKGCRNKTKMSRNDIHKYTNKTKQ